MTKRSPQEPPVIVIGAGGGGIGSAITRHLLAAHTPVIAVDRAPEPLEVLKSESAGQSSSQSRGATAELYPEIVDVTDSTGVDRLFERLEGEHPRLGGLVNVVGGLPFDRWRPLVEDDDENLDALLDTNLRAALRTSRAFARVQKSRWVEATADDAPFPASSIVQIATIAALEAMPYGGGYAASKAALISFTRTMALEWGRYGIRANAVAPGSIRVPKNDAHHDPDRDARVLPLGRRGTPDDVAGAAAFLLSEAATWITGQVLAVDGGASIKPAYLDDAGLPVFVQDPELRRRLLGEDVLLE